MSEERSTIFRDIPRVERNLLERVKGLSVANLHDALISGGHMPALLDGSIRPIAPGAYVCGQAVTALCGPGDSLSSHCALYLAQPGDVLVIASGGLMQGAVFGGNMAFDAKASGIEGAIVDASVRDTAEMAQMKFPVWARARSVVRTSKHGGGTVNMPLRCGGCLVTPGDIVVADDDGVLAFSPQLISKVVEAVHEKLRAEAAMRLKVKAGERLFETQKFSELLQGRGIEIHEGSWNAGQG